MKKNILFVLTVTIFTAACDMLLLGDEEEMISLEENLLPPPALADGLEVSSLATENVDVTLVNDAVKFVHEKKEGNVHSMLIVRNGKLVLESYFNGWNRNRRHDLRSATKSITSCLVGIAIDNGIISSVDEP